MHFLLVTHSSLARRLFTLPALYCLLFLASSTMGKPKQWRKARRELLDKNKRKGAESGDATTRVPHTFPPAPCHKGGPDTICNKK